MARVSGPALRLSPALLAGAPEDQNPAPLSARFADRLDPEISKAGHWPWRLALLAAVAHLALAGVVLLVSRVHLPKPPPEPVSISIVSQTTPQGANMPRPALPKQAQPQPAQASQPLPDPPPPAPTPQPAAPPSPQADLPPPPPPAPPVPKNLPTPKPVAQSASGSKIKADKMASVTVAVTHPAVPFADNQAPDYPQAAIDAREQGVVRFKLYLSTDGRVRNFVLTQSSGYADLDASVRRAAMGWRYQPATRGGVEVPSVVKFHVEFVPH